LKIPNPPILIITERKLTGEERLLDVVEKVFKGGCKWLMVREKDLARQDLIKLVNKIVDVAGSYKATVIVNNDFETAVACDADGVHLTAAASISNVRRIIGSDKMIGVSAHSLEETLKAEREGADYVTLSPIFKSISKKFDTRQPLGVNRLRDIVNKVSIPVIALGGINAENAKLCIEAGAAGVALLGYVMAAGDPCEAVAKLTSLFITSH